MSLQSIIQEQQAIEHDQATAKAEFAQLRQRMDSYIRNEFAKLQSRLDATDARINRLQFGEGKPAPVSTAAAKQMFPSPRPTSPTPPSWSDQKPGFMAAQPPPRSVSSQMQRSPSGAAGGHPSIASSSGSQTSSAARLQSPVDMQEVKESMVSATSQGQDGCAAWEEPKDGKPTPLSIDRAEEALRRAFEKTKEYQKHPNNPALGLTSIFKRLDRDHSGKVSKMELKNIFDLLNFYSTEDLACSLFARFDVDRSGLITIDELGKMLFRFDGDKHAKAMSAIARIREVLALRAGGFETMKTMGSQFRIMDRDKTGRLTREEFFVALEVLFSGYNLKFSTGEKNCLFQKFDLDKDGTVDYNEFTRGVRGRMNSFREEWVKKAFQLLDKDGSGIVTTDEILRSYDVSENPAVKSGKVPKSTAISGFMQHFDSNHDGTITLEEFLEAYQWVSASIDNDDYFELMMRNAWHIAGGDGWSANTSNLRVLVKHRNAPDEVVCVEQDLGLPRDPALRSQEVVRRLRAQGIKDIAKIEFTG